jgi:hypothetical protein
VRAIMLLLLVRGRGSGVLCRFCARASGCFLMVDTGRAIEGVLLGVALDVGTLALMLLLPGAVIDSLEAGMPNLLGVASMGWTAPSLVVGRLPPLLDIAEAGRSGGGMLLSALKKLDLRLPFPGPGEGGSVAKLSMVLSDSEGLDFFFVLCSASGSFSETRSGSSSFSLKPALDPAREDALDAERYPSKLPNASSSLTTGDWAGCGGPFEAWRDGGRAKGLLKTASLLAVVFVEAVEAMEDLDPKLGIPLTRLLVEATDARLGVGAVGAGAEGVYDGTRDSLDVFFCKGGCWLGRARDDTEGFLRSCSVDDGCRSWGWLPEDLSTGRRDVAGLGMPERRGMAEGWSMAAQCTRRCSGGQWPGTCLIRSWNQTPDA